MNSAEMAALHARAFVTPRPWSAAEIDALLSSPHCFALAEDGGFVMGRVIAGEAELLTIAVEPVLQGRGIGARLMLLFLHAAKRRGATSAFLEVAESNAPARGLYHRCDFIETGRRRGYYLGLGGQRQDAIVMTRPI